ncbi:MAG: HrcA family transcriptional regulator [Chloroflexi bacterium]|nr:HrcA family transcriptional regulator [Chloroflexota bacterium]
MGTVSLPLAERLRISHLFHQVERDLDEWLKLAASLIAELVHNAAIVTTPKPEACQFKHLELVSLQEATVLLILVLKGAKVREQLIVFDRILTQPELTAIASRLNASYSGLTTSQIKAKGSGQEGIERLVTDCLVQLTESEDNREYIEPFLTGLHFTLDQPEFTRNHRIALKLMELVEQRRLVKSIIPPSQADGKVGVIIGRENKAQAMQDFSVVFVEYGLPREATGAIGVIGPTRMPYARTIATVGYLSTVLSWLIAQLYGRSVPAEQNAAD